MANIYQIVAVIVGSTLMLLGIVYWLDSKPTTQLSLDQSGGQLQGPLSAEELEIVNAEVTNSMNPVATFSTNKGVIKLELFADKMPVTVGNFVTLAEDGFYNGTKFHRVIEGFMIQGGDPNSKGDNDLTYGTGGPGYTIQDEFVAGELLTNSRGTIAMANTGQPNSGGSQWFINLVDNTPLDFDKQPLSSKHPVFGRVIEGMDVVDAIGATETNQRDLPLEAVIIESIEVSEAEEAEAE